jgi:hypothetical protein
MSERIYAGLLRLYPSHFREAFADEARQLFRDRWRDEQGIKAKLRLWMDLAIDLATSLPRAHRHVEPAPAVTPAQSLGAAPGFLVLKPDVPPLSAIAFGGILSLLVFGSLFMWFGYGRNYRVLKMWKGPTKHDLYAGANARPVQFTIERTPQE